MFPADNLMASNRTSLGLKLNLPMRWLVVIPLTSNRTSLGLKLCELPPVDNPNQHLLIEPVWD